MGKKLTRESFRKESYEDALKRYLTDFENGDFHGRPLNEPLKIDRCFVCGRPLRQTIKTDHRYGGTTLMLDAVRIYNDRAKMLNLYCEEHQHLYYDDLRKMREVPSSIYVGILSSRILNSWMRSYDLLLAKCWKAYRETGTMRQTHLSNLRREEFRILHGTSDYPNWFEKLTVGVIDPMTVICRKRRYMAEHMLKCEREGRDGYEEIARKVNKDSDP